MVVLFQEILKAHPLHFAHKRLHVNILLFFLHGVHKSLTIVGEREEGICRHIVTNVVPVPQKIE